MNRRKLTTLALTGAVATIVGLSAAPAYAAQRTFVVTLLGGAQVTVTLDVPVETPVDQITFPGLDLPVVSVQEVTPAGHADVRRRPHRRCRPSRHRPDADVRGRQPLRSAPPGRAAAQQSGQDTMQRRPDGRAGHRARPRHRPRGAERRRRAAQRPIPATPAATTDGSPTPENPAFSLAHAGRRADRRAELLHRQVPDPAVPAADLPGRRHRVRRALGGPGGDQRDRDGLRPQPQRVARGRAWAGCSSSRHVEGLRDRRQRGRLQGSRTTRWTRSSPPRGTCGPPAPRPTCAGRSSPTTTPTGTSTASCCAPACSAACRRTSSARSPA